MDRFVEEATWLTSWKKRSKATGAAAVSSSRPRGIGGQAPADAFGQDAVGDHLVEAVGVNDQHSAKDHGARRAR